MIVMDIETTGLSPIKNGIVEIAALKFENPNICFQTLCRIDDEEIDPVALEVNGQSVEEVKDLNRSSQKEALVKFFEWIKEQEDFCVIGQNVGEFDWRFINIKAEKYGLDFPLHKRSLDLHTLVFFRYFQVYRKFPIENGKSLMNLNKILEFVGIKDERKYVSGGKVVKEGKFHGALEDCKLEAECFSRLIYGKGLFDEYAKFPIPEYLKR